MTNFAHLASLVPLVVCVGILAALSVAMLPPGTTQNTPSNDAESQTVPERAAPARGSSIPDLPFLPSTFGLGAATLGALGGAFLVLRREA